MRDGSRSRRHSGRLLGAAAAGVDARHRLDYESMNAAGTFLGSGGVIVIDDRTCLVDALLNITRFYRHESCGKCTPCREGTYWMEEVLARLERGEGRERDIDLLDDVADNINGKSSARSATPRRCRSPASSSTSAPSSSTTSPQALPGETGAASRWPR